MNKIKRFMLDKGINEKEIEIFLNAIKEDTKCELVYKNHSEKGLEELKKNFPILQDISEKEILTDSSKPTNILIEGDNLHSLNILRNTHKGLIDVIYIDPPYNTLNEKGFRYNDKMVDENDKDRHSKWLSFMRRRLELAWELLSDDGVIFVSIDDNEQAHLRLLMDDIFLEKNFIENFMWLHGKGKKTKHSRTLQQHTLCYTKNKMILNEWREKTITDYEFSNPDNDPKGVWFSGSISFSEKRSNPKHKNYYEITSPSGVVWCRQWQVSEGEMGKLITENDIYWGIVPMYDNVPRVKIRPSTNEIIPLNIIKDKGTTKSAINDLRNILHTEEFDYPKPVELIKHLIKITNKSKNAIILDFFAGSGTTGQAVMELNKEDGGNRQFILCTNNEVSEDIEIEHLVSINKLPIMPTSKRSKAYKEWRKVYEDYKATEDYQMVVESAEYQSNGICQAVTYQRNKKVIEGYTTPKNKYVEGLGGNLKYYKVGLVEKSIYKPENITNLLSKVNEIISIKENCFRKVEEEIDYIIFENEEKVVLIYNYEYANDSDLERMANKLGKYNKEKIIYTVNSSYNKIGINFKKYPEWMIDLFSKSERMV